MRIDGHKKVMLAVQPYYVYLIIAREMGWDVWSEKQVEVRKSFPTSTDWDKSAVIYCSKNKKSFNQIPKEYQPAMKKLLGKVIGEFICNRISTYPYTRKEGYGGGISEEEFFKTALTGDEFCNYGGGKTLYGWHISGLKFFDDPKEVKDYAKVCNDSWDPMYGSYCVYCEPDKCRLKRPPQSWCYIQEK